ncbi:MAG: amino acid permease [Bacteroidota bacterium]
MEKAPQKIGLLITTSLVVGNMIGSGIFVLPAALAAYGSISLLGWLFTAAGAIVLAKIFSNLSKLVVNRSGGPYIYAREGFGDFIGFLVAWGYWISIWITNGAIAIAIVSALSFFFPMLKLDPVLSMVVGLAFIWFFTWTNSLGVKESGKIQLGTTLLKIIPLLFVIVVGLFYFETDNFPTFNATEGNDFSALSAAATLTLFAFLGLESATIPASHVKQPARTIPRATLLGTLIVTGIYILGTVVLFGILPWELLVDSPAPFAEAAKLIGGEYAGYLVAAGAAIAAIGALNGWILIMGQIPMATAKDRLFPDVFSKKNKNGIPWLGLVIGSLLSSLVMFMNYTEGLVKQFEFMVLLTTLCCLIPFVFAAASYVLIAMKDQWKISGKITTIVLASLGFAYALWAVYGSGSDTVFYGFLLLLCGVPLYVYMKWRR